MTRKKFSKMLEVSRKDSLEKKSFRVAIFSVDGKLFREKAVCPILNIDQDQCNE